MSHEHLRRFDHDEARRLRAEGWTYQQIADKVGVTPTAVQHVVNDESRQRQRARHLEWQRRTKRHPCRGGCGRLVWTTSPTRTGYCHRCLTERRTTTVRPDTLQCSKCGEWKPDDDFYRKAGSPIRRDRASWCKQCQNRARREWRHAHPHNRERDRRTAANRNRRRIAMAMWVVLKPGGDGYQEVARVKATTTRHAIEEAATGPGVYIAVVETSFRPMKVEPVQAFRVVADGLESSPAADEPPPGPD